MAGIMIDRRRFAAAAAALAFAAPAARAWTEAPLERLVGRMLILGFSGDAPGAATADALAAELEAGQAGGALFLRHNARTREGVEGLARQFRAASPDAFLAIDQEGGYVQRLNEAMGYFKIPTARALAAAGPEAAREALSRAARELAAAGFDMNLAPIADLHQDGNAVIARWDRAFGSDPATVADWCALFVEAMEAEGVVCSLKHFPGHGRSDGDSHDGFVDISGTWGFEEAEPFARLIEAGRAHLVMGGHLVNTTLDPEGAPATLSRPVMQGLLRDRLGFQGAAITDDMDMGAIRSHYTPEQAFVQAVAAGNDLILWSNSADHDPDLARRAVDWAGAAIDRGELTMDRLVEANLRIDALRAIGRPG